MDTESEDFFTDEWTVEVDVSTAESKTTISTWSVSTTVIGGLSSTSPGDESGPSTTVIALAASLGAVGILFIVFLALFIALKQRRTKRGRFSRPDTTSYKYEMTNMGNSISQSSSLYLNLKAFVPRLAEKDVQITDDVVGEGRFGPMFNGVLKVSGDNKHVIYKTLKENTKESERKFFMDQLEIYSSFEFHDNVVKLYGVCISSDFIFAAFEFAERGNMRQFLRRYSAMPESQQSAVPDTPEVTTEFLIKLALGVASGMRHLASRGIVHRELAAKHIMLTEDFTPKVAGLNTVKAVNKHISIRWMSPEVMSDRMYTLMSDVWSFGVVVWEIMSMGSKPFPNTSTRDIYLALQNGTRMTRPANCDANVYSLMKWCWEDDPYERPTFLVITKTLQDIVKSNADMTKFTESKKALKKQSEPEPDLNQSAEGAKLGLDNASYVTAHSMELGDDIEYEISM